MMNESTGAGQQSGEPVEVYAASNDLEAQVIKSFLESNGIPVLLRGESLGTTLGVAMGRLARVSVMVPEPLADKATQLLEQHLDEENGEQ
ncbi:MAG: DUF2007 domain-containing protein [Chloroflexota bacterium]|nr:DUF2007 domain-containing protein [Chloroflexota bacterium]